VCEAKFQLTDEEISDLNGFSEAPLPDSIVTVSKDYAGRFEVLFPQGIFPDRIHPSEIESACAALPMPGEPVDPQFKEAAAACIADALRLAREGRFTDLSSIGGTHMPILEVARHRHDDASGQQTDGKCVSEGCAWERPRALSRWRRLPPTSGCFALWRYSIFNHLAGFVRTQNVAKAPT
jgi:hypothetical protein